MSMPRRALRLAVWIVVCITVGIEPVPAADPSRSCLFPVFDSDTNEFLGLSMVNTSGAVNEATITWTNADGSRGRTGRISLPPGAQRALLVREILGMPQDPPDGWLRIESLEPGLLSYLTSGTNTKLDGTEGVLQPATTIVFGHIAVNTGLVELGHTDTHIALVNPGSVPASGRAELIGIDGRTVGSLEISIPASGSRIIRVSESFRDVLPENNLGGRKFDGYVKMASDVGIAGWQRVETPLSRGLLRGRAVEEIVPESQLLAAHFASGGMALYSSVLNLINGGDSPLKLTLTAQDERGNNIGSIVQLTLEPRQGVREDILRIFHVVIPAIYPPPLITGTIRIRAAEGHAFSGIGDVAIFSAGNAASMLYPVTRAVSRDWTLPFVVSGQDYFTGYAIANPNELLTVQTDVTVDLLDTEGHPAAPTREISLSPSARLAELVGKDIRSGYLRIQANLPIVLLGSIGTSDGSALATLPALR